MAGFNDLLLRLVGSLGLSVMTCNRLAWIASGHPRGYITDMPRRARERWYRAKAETTTVHDVMRGIERLPLRGNVKTGRWSSRKNAILPKDDCIRLFEEKLRALGMTADDWPYLANRSVIELHLFSEAGKKGRKNLLRQPAQRLQPQLSTRALKRLAVYLHKDPAAVTVGDLVKSDPREWAKGAIRSASIYVESWDCAAHNVWKSVVSTRERLMQLGLGYKDGFFFQVGTRRYALARIQERFPSFSRREARVVLKLIGHPDLRIIFDV
ncbi:MAG TPA: hypothetical protein VG102_00950 [Candidatus Paceibacterota bacterium]|jgi:hypothetical protein|nr:hypothetical protein [Candidatus Paceibacterota bacterium]